VDFVLLVWYWY